MKNNGKHGLTQKHQRRNRFPKVTALLLTHFANFYSLEAGAQIASCHKHGNILPHLWETGLLKLFNCMLIISHYFNFRYADAVILNLEDMLLESNIRIPMVCLLSQGSDPTNQITDLAKKRGIEARAISMGQGQEVHARRLVSLSIQTGGWSLLQNCHLGLDFMDELLETVLTAENVNPLFRVWITTEEHPKFQITLLQSSIKVSLSSVRLNARKLSLN